jgi:hypothetical protein
MLSALLIIGIISLFKSFFFSFWWDWGLNAGLQTSKQGFYHLSPPVHFALVILEMEVSQTICPGWPGTAILISAS